jgi:hypothetical protein
MTRKLKKYVKWSKHSRDGKLLYKMLLNKDINMNARPKSVLIAMGWLGKYSTNSFRSAFHRTKGEVKDNCTFCPKSMGPSRGNKIG